MNTELEHDEAAAENWARYKPSFTEKVSWKLDALYCALTGEGRGSAYFGESTPDLPRRWGIYRQKFEQTIPAQDDEWDEQQVYTARWVIGFGKYFATFPAKHPEHREFVFNQAYYDKKAQREAFAAAQAEQHVMDLEAIAKGKEIAQNRAQRRAAAKLEKRKN